MLSSHRISLISIFSFVLIIGHSTAIPQENLKLELKVKNIHAWADFMPGSQHSFNLTGDLKITNNASSKINELKLDSLYVYQNGVIIYKIKPGFEDMTGSGIILLAKGETRNCKFGTNGKLSLNKELSLDKSVDLSLKFLFNGEIYIYKIKNVKVEKTY
jgi:hypothetical protein